eukprot:4887793-Alexandrium_andersonii.AAC.1
MVKVPEVSFIDDLASPLNAPTAKQLPMVAAKVAKVADEVARAHFLDLHFLPKKTAAVLSPRGRGPK